MRGVASGYLTSSMSSLQTPLAITSIAQEIRPDRALPRAACAGDSELASRMDAAPL